jgi:hypothetical protein
MKKGHYGRYSGNARHSKHITNSWEEEDVKRGKKQMAEGNTGHAEALFDDAHGSYNYGAAQRDEPLNEYTPSGTKEQLVLPSKESLRMGGSGAFGLVGGVNLFSAGKQILKSGIGSTNLISAGKQFLNSPHVNAVKGAVNSIKNVLKKKRTTSITNPIPGSTKAYNKLQYPMGKNAFNKPPVVDQSRNLKQQWPSSKFKSGIGVRGPIPTFPK